MVENLAASLRLLLVTDDALLQGRDPVGLCVAAVRGGVTSVQLRLKHASDAEFLGLARALRQVLTVPLFINDRMDIALASMANGVHLGPDDIPPSLARRIAPPGFVIGASVGADTEVERGGAADYWGIGPLNPTRTKSDAGAPLGWDGATKLKALAAGRPCIVIGGVDPSDVAEAIARRFAGVAASRGILGTVDVESAAARYRM